MRPEVLNSEIKEILSRIVKYKPADPNAGISLTEEQRFRLWNELGEELGIDLSLIPTPFRTHLLDIGSEGLTLQLSSFSGLLWLVFYYDLYTKI
jgi:hypothetical protein